ncbi:hypothetical protein BpHYR1_047933 [Brachionus plicatilis]|uniref:Uncharacterized protein n=1 Tax=Brachionus plicatilis TaxID=10195 RepID=A0A3M7PHN0_BRAPC|nr:hypothetical protein BpHYR1_047933 [Brachionus plicatilis]
MIKDSTISRNKSKYVFLFIFVFIFNKIDTNINIFLPKKYLDTKKIVIMNYYYTELNWSHSLVSIFGGLTTIFSENPYLAKYYNNGYKA